MSTKIRLKEINKIAQIEFDHPEKDVNLLDTEAMLQLKSILETLQKRTDLSAVLVTST